MNIFVYHEMVQIICFNFISNGLSFIMSCLISFFTHDVKQPFSSRWQFFFRCFEQAFDVTAIGYPLLILHFDSINLIECNSED